MTNDANNARFWKQSLIQALVVAALMVASLGCYLLVLKWRGPDAVFLTYLPLDDWIPFEPTWVWVYLLPYIVGPIGAALLRRETFVAFTKRALAVMAATLLIFILLPTQTAPRPAPPPPDSLTNRLYRWMAEIDEPPANAAPSLHVSLTCLLALALCRDFPRWCPLVVACAGLVLLATLGTRQHHALDVVTGMTLAGAAAWLIGRAHISERLNGKTLC